MKLPVITLDNESKGEVDVAETIFGLPIRVDILHRVVEWQRAKARSGNHKTKGISDISGTTKKPYKQKGTGNARQGSMRSPQFRGGARIFGPVVRSHAYDLPKKIRRLGLKTALSAKLKEGKLSIIEDASLSAPKSKDLKLKLQSLGWKSTLFIAGEQVEENFALSIRNLPKFDVLPQVGTNVYDILRHDNIAITREALSILQTRLA